ncbi:hypothetical protein BURPS668_A0819 [Burkholderia pseudomallei 668]|nr:hypothetical protein BURPS668_A0819 [Burkholderia pseudomallei 668]
MTGRDDRGGRGGAGTGAGVDRVGRGARSIGVIALLAWSAVRQ